MTKNKPRLGSVIVMTEPSPLDYFSYFRMLFEKVGIFGVLKCFQGVGCLFCNIPTTSKLFSKEKPSIIKNEFFFLEGLNKNPPKFWVMLLTFSPLKLSKYRVYIFSQNKNWHINWYYSFKYIILYFYFHAVKNLYSNFILIKKNYNNFLSIVS